VPKHISLKSVKVARSFHRKILSGGIKELITVNMTSTLGQGNKLAEHFEKEEIAVPSLDHFQKILDSVELDLSDFASDMAYSGFDKSKVAQLAASRLGAKRTVKFCFLGGMRGTNLKRILERSAKVDPEIQQAYKAQKIVSNGTGPETLTMGRLMATFPEITAHYMKKNEVPKKLSDDNCPAALQFPAAAGLPMSHHIRMLHLEFSVRFSFLISRDKKFYAQYYRAAFNGQQEINRLSAQVKELVGNPSYNDSRSFDLDTAIKAMMEKYGEDRFVLNSGAQGNQPDSSNIPV
jgi:hypothetical protein